MKDNEQTSFYDVLINNLFVKFLVMRRTSDMSVVQEDSLKLNQTKVAEVSLAAKERSRKRYPLFSLISFASPVLVDRRTAFYGYPFPYSRLCIVSSLDAQCALL